MNTIERESSVLQRAESIALTATPALLAFATLGQKAVKGAIFSAGGEPFIGDSRFSSVFSTSENLDNIIRFRDANLHFKGSVSPKFGFGKKPDVFTLGIDRKLRAGGLQPTSFLTHALPIAMTAYGLVSAGAEGGASAVVENAIQDVFANYYGMQAATSTFNIVDAKKVGKLFNVGADTLKDMNQVSISRGFAGSPMLGRIVPTMGGYVGADVGMSVGQVIGEKAAGLYNMKRGTNIDEDIAGLVGGIFGAAGGAAAGAAMFGSLKRTIISGIGLTAASIITSTGMNALQAGFENIGKGRQGFNFASDVSAHFTNNAVTMRQRAVQAMHKSHMNARSAFGQEASLVHMNRDYFSHYKR